MDTNCIGYNVDVSGCSPEVIKAITQTLSRVKEDLQKVADTDKEENKKKETKKRWKPNFGEDYFRIDPFGNITSLKWENDVFDNKYYNARNIYKTKEEAEFEVERRKIMTELQNYADEHNGEIDHPSDALWIAFDEDDINLSYSFKTFVRKDNCKTVSHAYSDPVSGHNAVDNPSHYCGTKYQVINFIEDWGLGYCLGNVVKYICRAGKKYVGDKQKELQDLKKAKWYLERRLEEHKNGVELDSDDLKMNISIDDFAEDQKLNYIRKKIIKNVIDCIYEEIDTKFYTALELLDTEINRMEDETA